MYLYYVLLLSSANPSYFPVEELESEFYRDIEVASLADSDRIAKRISTASLEGSSSTASKESKEQ